MHVPQAGNQEFPASVDHACAGLQLTLPARCVDERVGSGRPDDHVRLLPRNRLEHDAVVGLPRAGAKKLVAFPISTYGARKSPFGVYRSRLRRTLEGEHRRSHEQLAGDE